MEALCKLCSIGNQACGVGAVRRGDPLSTFPPLFTAGHAGQLTNCI